MQKLHALIVSLPGVWQRMLKHNIEAYSFIHVDNVASGGLSALQLMGKRTPNLLVIDSSIPLDDANFLVQKVKESNPDIQIIILADTTSQRMKILRSGADFAVSSYNYEEEIGEILLKMNSTTIENYVNLNE